MWCFFDSSVRFLFYMITNGGIIMRKSNNNWKVKMLLEIINSKDFYSLDDELKEKILEYYYNLQIRNQSQKVDFVTKLFGAASKHSTIQFAFVVSTLLILVGFVYILLPLEYKGNSNVEFWQIITPIITGLVGYVFGKKDK